MAPLGGPLLTQPLTDFLSTGQGQEDDSGEAKLKQPLDGSELPTAADVAAVGSAPDVETAEPLSPEFEALELELAWDANAVCIS